MNKINRTILAGTLSASAVYAAERPNIMVILTDDSGYTDLGCYGGEIDTPNLDRLARNGLRFSNFYTNGRCSPTRASLLTGRDSAHAGFAAGTLGGWRRESPLPSYRARLSAEIPTLAELLKGCGYQTMMAGKWHLGGSTMRENPAEQAIWKRLHPGWELTQEEIDADWNAMPSQRGFDRFFGMIEGETDFFFLPEDRHDYLEGNDPAELWFDQTYTIETSEPRKFAKPFKHQGKTAQAFYDTDGLTDRVVEMLREADANRPFFMYVAYRAPHLPLHAPKELVDKYLPRYADAGQVEKNRIEGLIRQGLFPDGAPYSMRFQNEPPGSGERHSFQHQLAVHAAMMEDVDRNVGRLMRSLEESGQLDNTLILYLSDNGAAHHVGHLLNKPYNGVKALMWEGGTKTHCIAHWPAKIKPGSITHTTGWVGDFLPTALELAGAEYPPEWNGKPTAAPLDGRSIVPALLGKEMPPPEALFFNDRGQQSVIYQGRWKLLIEPGWYPQTSKVSGVAYELYDLQNDPAETKNLASQFPEMVQKLAAECEAWQKRCGMVDYGEILEANPNH
jgi:arylsulfatase A-like enzyme